MLHNVVHLLYGVAGILMSRRAGSAVTYLVAGGAVYLVLWIYGLVVGARSMAVGEPVRAAAPRRRPAGSAASPAAPRG